MQQTKSYWRLVAVAGVVSAFVAGACTVTTSTDVDDDDTAGAGGSGTAGAGTAGSSTAGAGTAGAAAAGAGAAGAGTAGEGPVPFQCDPAGDGGAQGIGNTCAPTDPNDICQKCIQAKCCAEYSACYATDPGNQCGWGGPAKVDGDENPGGELYCVQACLQKAVVDSGTAPDDSQVQTCGNNCATTISSGATKECGSVLGIQTSDAVGCLRDNCSVECFGA